MKFWHDGEHWCTVQHKEVNLLERVQRRAMEVIGGLEHFCEDSLRDLGLFSQEKGKLWGALEHFALPRWAARELEREF